MPPANQPLFTSDRHSSIHSEERAAQEDDALLENRQDNSDTPTPSNRSGFWREVALFTWALLATAVVVLLAVLLQHRSAEGKPKNATGKRNLIFMVSDGMGPASLSLTRSFQQYQYDLPIGDVLVLDQYLIGSSRTRSNSSLITDSAAGATAFSCGEKSYNGAISILPDYTPCGTVLEAAKRAGYMTGLVVTTAITDATPACFASHVNIRLEEDLIAQQEVGQHPLGRVVDLMLGGGRCHFLPNTTRGSCRADNLDVVKLAQEEHGWHYIDNRQDFDDLQSGRSAVKLPVLGLFAGYNIPFEIDRRNENDMYPSLEEMTRTALRALEEATRDSDKGFFLMVEGSRIDHAGHNNDPAAQVHEVLAYDKAFASVVEFLRTNDVDGVLVATSGQSFPTIFPYDVFSPAGFTDRPVDHETGGLVTARRKCTSPLSSPTNN
jgi:alkaline phosphatase